MALFESYDRRIDQINKALNDNGISSIEEAKKICETKRASTRIRSAKAHRTSASRTRSGHML